MRFTELKKRKWIEEKIENKVRYLFILIKGIKKLNTLLKQILKTPVWIIKSGQCFTSKILLEEFLMEIINDPEILLCDPYISSETLYPFRVLKKRIKSLKILTANINVGIN